MREKYFFLPRLLLWKVLFGHVFTYVCVWIKPMLGCGDLNFGHSYGSVFIALSFVLNIK